MGYFKVGTKCGGFHSHGKVRSFRLENDIPIKIRIYRVTKVRTYRLEVVYFE
jgi:hypothetical protein